jgi:Domain of unknown function (DUF397)
MNGDLGGRRVPRSLGGDLSANLPDGVQWRRSSRCNGGSCVEVSADGGKVRVRNSTDPAGAVLEIGRAGWQAFLVELREGHFGEA